MQKLKTFLSKQPLFLLLVVILIVITAGSLQPSFYLLGWDNFSADLNLPVNLGRILFDTWRDYRGLGVASDSEIVDLFRQLFFLILSPVVPSTMLGQLYLMFSFWAGVLLMYLFSFKLYKSISTSVEQLSSPRAADLFAFLAAFFYLFNLSTLAVFYFPMLPYTTRFFAIPALHLALFEIFQNKFRSFRQISGYVLLILFTSTSYITATIFITMGISLFIHGLSYLNFKRLIIFFAIFIGLNLFWLLPFINYTFDKANDIQLSPANIEGNEVLLNKSPEFYSLSKQLIFYSTFFDIKYTDPQTHTLVPFYSLVKNFNQFGTMSILYVFPLLYLAGSLFILISNRRLSLIWIPIHIVFFLFLSLQDHGPGGPLYQFISDKIPLFAVIFRFGDAKFHPFLAFAGSLASALLIITFLFSFLPYLFFKLQNLMRLESYSTLVSVLITTRFAILFMLLIPLLFSFKTYLNGNFVGYFMYNKIPAAYFEIAKIVNSDPENIRVLHLPFDEVGYWRPFSWGYFGSSFFHFLISKPYFDRTFEPASKENIIFDNTIYSLISQIPNISDQSNQDLQINKLYQMLNDASIKYLILDETIDIHDSVRDQDYWGVFSVSNARTSLEQLKAKGYVRERARYSLNFKNIVLYEMVNTPARIQFFGKGQNIDPNLEYLAQSPLYPSDRSIFTQPKPETNSLTFPFARQDIKVTDAPDVVTYEIPSSSKKSNELSVKTYPTVKNGSRLIKITANDALTAYVITLSEVTAPQIQDYSFEQDIGSILVPKSADDLRLMVDDQVMTIPRTLSDREQILGYVLVHQNPFLLNILQAKPPISLPTALLRPTNPTDCQNTALAGYNFSSQNTETGTVVNTTNGSGCLVTNLDSFNVSSLPYAELTVDLSLNGSSNDGSAASLVNLVPKPNTAYFCIKELGFSHCTNPDQIFSFNGDKRVILPIQNNGAISSSFIFALRNINYQKLQAVIKQLSLKPFEDTSSYKVILLPESTYQKTISLTGDTLTLKLPKTLSSTSSFNSLDHYSLSLSDAPCEDKQGYATIHGELGKFLLFTQKCGNGLFYTSHILANDMYLWMVDYNLISGQYPFMKIYDADNESTYVNQRASLNQGYPAISIFKQFDILGQLPKNVLQNIQTTVAAIVVPPSVITGNQKDKVFAFSQYTEDAGALVIKSDNIIALPPRWNNLTLEPIDNTISSYQTPQNFTSVRLFPFLWKITIKGEANPGEKLMLFKEGYDPHWNLYSTPGGILTGSVSKAKHIRCNSLYNCYIFAGQKSVRGEQELYLFYDTEKLSLLGISSTLLFIICTLVFARRLLK